MATEAELRAHRKYEEKAYDRLSIILPKGTKDKIKAITDETGNSINGFIRDAVLKEIEKNTK